MDVDDVEEEHCHFGEERYEAIPTEDEEVETDDEEVQCENEELMVNTPVREVVSTPVHDVVDGNGELFEREVYEPAMGMVFSCWEDADNFFREYGKQNGFGIIRAGGNYKQENGKTNFSKRRSYTWKCECAGQVEIRRVVDGTRVRGGGLSLDLNRRKTKKCGCKVQMHCKVRDDCLWEVRNVVTKHTGHNNPTPGKSRYIHMYRQDEITSVVRRRLFTDARAGTKVRQIHRSLAKQRNGIENMAFTKRDLRNILAKEKKLKLVGGDANAMLAYFDRMSADNQNFYHKYRLDAI